MFFRREDESEGEDDEEYRFDENDAAEIANANEAAQLDADLEKLNSSEEVTDEDLSELYAEQCVDNKDISEDDQVKFLSSALIHICSLAPSSRAPGIKLILFLRRNVMK